MKKIGFIDFYISEWHANNYPDWIKNACEKLGLDYTVAYAWAEQFQSPFDGRNTDEWCSAYRVKKCESIEELCEKSDVIVILAPSNPEKHLGYAEIALTYGKRTYIDKTFAPDYATAIKIFEIAGKHNTPFFSTSALRYASELDEVIGCDNVLITGGGSNFDEYIIHQVEPAVKLLDARAISAYAYDQGGQTVSNVKFEGGKNATLSFAEPLPFTVCTEKGVERRYQPLNSDFFKNLTEDILRFFENGVLPFEKWQTLEVMKIREGLINSRKTGEVIKF